MSFIEDSNNGDLTGVVEKTIVPAPDPGVRSIIKTITIKNPLTAGLVVLIVSKKDTAGATSEIWSGDLETGDTWIFGDGDVEVLNKPTQSIIAKLSTNPAINPEFTASWGESA